MGGGSKTTTPAPTATTPTATTHTTSTTTESQTTTVGNVKTTTGRNNVVTTPGRGPGPRGGRITAIKHIKNDRNLMEMTASNVFCTFFPFSRDLFI